jgi:thiamine biosynthesis lipoprotein ApbE
VVARYGIDADSWSTALSVLGPERGMAFVEKHPGLGARFTIGRETSFHVVESSGWLSQTCHIAPER